MMVHFVGAGPGAADLITVRGVRLIRNADVIIYAGSLVDMELLKDARAEAEIYDSAHMTLEEIIHMIEKNKDREIVRLHTGGPALYGAMREQTEALDRLGIEYDVCPGVSSMFGAASALCAEFTVPGVSQTLIATRMAGRTPVPEDESIESLSRHGASMAVFLSAAMAEELSERLQSGGYAPNTPAAIVYKATWREEKVVKTTVSEIGRAARDNGINKTALILVGNFLGSRSERSKLYDPKFSHSEREASE